ARLGVEYLLQPAAADQIVPADAVQRQRLRKARGQIFVHAQEDLISALGLDRSALLLSCCAHAQQADEQLLYVQRHQLLRAERSVLPALQRHCCRVVKRGLEGALRLGYYTAYKRALRFARGVNLVAYALRRLALAEKAHDHQVRR